MSRSREGGRGTDEGQKKIRARMCLLCSVAVEDLVAALYAEIVILKPMYIVVLRVAVGLDVVGRAWGTGSAVGLLVNASAHVVCIDRMTSPT